MTNSERNLINSVVNVAGDESLSDKDILELEDLDLMGNDLTEEDIQNIVDGTIGVEDF